jgi:sialate O-acetylesterase
MKFNKCWLALAVYAGCFSSYLFTASGDALASGCNSALSLSPLFQEDMVIQDSRPRIWGRGTPGTLVSVSLPGRLGAEARAKVSPDGDWAVVLPVSTIAPGPAKLEVADSCQKIELSRILVGDVWLCSGQSNMEWRNSWAGGWKEQLDNFSHEFPELSQNLRFFQVAQAATDQPRTAFPAGSLHHKWNVPSASQLAGFSAVCYQFGRNLHKKLGKPIGLIQAAYGATKIEAWIPYASVAPEQRITHPTLEKARTAAVYNAMIAPLAAFTLKGVAWYQGETNSGWATYGNLLSRLTGSWRSHFLNQKLPFHIVQLANFCEGAIPLEDCSPKPLGVSSIPLNKTEMYDFVRGRANLQFQQYRFSEKDPLAFLVTAIGTATTADANRNHPLDKATVAQRLVRSAMENTYRQEAKSSPRWLHSSARTYATSKRNALLVPFALPAGVAGPAIGTPIDGFVLRGKDSKEYFKASGSIYSVKTSGAVWIWVESDMVSDPAEVRFQWADNPYLSYRAPGTEEPLSPVCLDLKPTGAWSLCELGTAL